MVIAQRENDLKIWLTSLFKHQAYELIPLAGDASFRRYFRLRVNGHSYVVMDAPPGKEDCDSFVAIACGLNQHQINTPLIHHQNLADGFLLLSDFGDAVYLTQLNPHNADSLYHHAIDTLVQLQTCTHIPGFSLKKFDSSFITAEISNLFDTWFIQNLLGVQLSHQQQQVMQTAYQLLVTNAISQPQVIIHRDYHSRNLMVTPTNTPGVLDFQDAMIGPISYDLVSLLRDCYIAWPQTQINGWINYYLQQARDKNIITSIISEQQFKRWFDLMGIQRHLKAIGIFARLKLRDGKTTYLQDIPRTLNYVTTITQQYPDLAEFHQLLLQTVVPEFR